MFVTVCDPCLDNDHENCDEKNPQSKLVLDRETARKAHLPGGGMCICAVCNPEINQSWYEHVRDHRLETRG